MRLPGQTLLQLRVAAGVDADLPGVVGRVHQFVAAVPALPRHPRQWYGGLAVVERRRGQDAAYRDVAVGGVDMQFVPSLCAPSRCASRPCRGPYRAATFLRVSFQISRLERWTNPSHDGRFDPNVQ